MKDLGRSKGPQEMITINIEHILPRFAPFKNARYEEQTKTTLEVIPIGNELRVETFPRLPIVVKYASPNCPDLEERA